MPQGLVSERDGYLAAMCIARLKPPPIASLRQKPEASGHIV